MRTTKQRVLSFCIWSALLFLVTDLLFDPTERQLQQHNVAHDNQSDTMTKETEINDYSANAGASASSSTDSTHYPQWLLNYIDWHAKQLSRSTSDDGGEVRYLIVDHGFGGLADRLKSLPYYLWLASKHGRVLLIYWNKYCRIDEFFVPNAINWTVPSTVLLHNAVRLNKRFIRQEYDHNLIGHDAMNAHKSDQVIRVSDNRMSAVKGIPQVVAESNNDRRVFRSIFHSLFHLSQPVQELLDRTKKEVGNDYIGVHLRARYLGVSDILDGANDDIDAKGITNVTFRVRDEILKLSNHAIDCTRKAAGDADSQVYFASDTLLAMELQHEKDDRIVYLQTKNERAHFSQMKLPQCDRYYPAIVDLWMLSEAKCIGFGVGGFGAVATMMSKFDCWTIHQKNVMLRDQFEQSTNIFRNDSGNGELPECLLLPSTKIVEA